jgi:membrane protein YqaA with SNARE-associated domain
MRAERALPVARQRRRIVTLAGIAAAVAVVSVGLWVLGQALPSPLLRFVGLMTVATTFVPLPADSFVLAASAHVDPVVIGVVGGFVNAAVVLVERRWVLALVDHPSFDRFVSFFDTNRYVALTERNLFVGLLVGGASFIPFEPFRLVAVMRDYSPVRYALATFVSRGGRYYVLAVAGSALLDVGYLQQAIWLSVGLFLVGLWRSGVKLARGGTQRAAPDEEG